MPNIGDVKRRVRIWSIMFVFIVVSGVSVFHGIVLNARLRDAQAEITRLEKKVYSQIDIGIGPTSQQFNEAQQRWFEQRSIAGRTY